MPSDIEASAPRTYPICATCRHPWLLRYVGLPGAKSGWVWHTDCRHTGGVIIVGSTIGVGPNEELEVQQ
jgi:hypothetical protein